MQANELPAIIDDVSDCQPKKPRDRDALRREWVDECDGQTDQWDDDVQHDTLLFAV